MHCQPSDILYGSNYWINVGQEHIVSYARHGYIFPEGRPQDDVGVFLFLNGKGVDMSFQDVKGKF